MKPYYGGLRVLFKRFYMRLGGTLIEFCKTCGRRQPLVWTATDELWLAVVGSPNGVRCPECFTKEAWKLGLFLRWRSEVE